MDLPPSKLATTASRVWDESNSHFHKTDINIDLGLHGGLSLNSNKNGKENSSEKATSSTSAISSGYVFGSRVFEQQKEDSTGSTSSESDNSKVSIDVSSIFRRIGQKNSNANGTNMWKTSSAFSTISKINGGNGEASKDDLSSLDKLKESAEELAHKNASIVAADDGEQPLVVTGEEDERQLLKIDCKFYHYNSETKQWQERGMGTLRLNQHIGSKDDIRLIGRQSGSQRVLINSKIFPEMLLQELSEKRIQISAHTGDVDLPPQLFIIQSSPSSITNLQMLLQTYIEESCTSNKNIRSNSSISQQRKRRLEEEEELQILGKNKQKSKEKDESSSSSTDKGATKKLFVKEKSPTFSMDNKKNKNKCKNFFF